MSIEHRHVKYIVKKYYFLLVIFSLINDIALFNTSENKTNCLMKLHSIKVYDSKLLKRNKR